MSEGEKRKCIFVDINKYQPCWEISFDNYEKIALVGGKYKEKIMEACEEYSALRG